MLGLAAIWTQGDTHLDASIYATSGTPEKKRDPDVYQHRHSVAHLPVDFPCRLDDPSARRYVCASGLSSSIPGSSHGTEGDAASYVVMRALGLPSRVPACIAWHGGRGALVLRSLKRIQRAARWILRGCEHSHTCPTAHPRRSTRVHGRALPATST